MSDLIFFRIGNKVRPVGSILLIEEKWTDLVNDPHPLRSPIPLDSVTVHFADGDKAVFTGEDADRFAKWYRPLCFLFDGSQAEGDGPNPITPLNQSRLDSSVSSTI